MSSKTETSSIKIYASERSPIEKIECNFVFLKSVDVFAGKNLYYIPGFDVHFAAATQEEALSKSQAMIKSFFDFWIKIQGFKSFVLEINKRGFKAASNDFVVQNLIKHKKVGGTSFKLRRDNSAPFKIDGASLVSGKVTVAA